MISDVRMEGGNIHHILFLSLRNWQSYKHAHFMQQCGICAVLAICMIHCVSKVWQDNYKHICFQLAHTYIQNLF